MASFIAKRNLSLLVMLLMLLLGIGGAVALVLALEPAIKDSAAGTALAGVAAIATLMGVFATGFQLLGKVDAIHLNELERDLSNKYGVSIEHASQNVWKIDGELRQATLYAGALLVGGRELATA